MAFNINAQIVLSGPKNLNSITKQISSQLSKATKINLNIGGNTSQLNNISKQLTTISSTFTKLNSNLKSTRTSIAALNSSFNKAGAGLNNLGNAQKNLASQTNSTNQSLQKQQGLLANLAGRFGSVAKQAIAFGLISRPIYDLQRALTSSVKDAVSFQKEIVKISQVTGQSVKQLDGLRTTISNLSTSLGTSANELAETARVIAQTGKTAQETEIILRSLARSTLAPTFGSLRDTTEGLIAALGQFNLRASDSEAILGSLNKVSKNFAVEAEDLISVIRRTGGVFAQAAGNSRNTIGALQELISVFTAVRSTTRESADTIAAGLRTIFSRLQRRGTIEFLKQFGVQLTDAKGQFIGIFPAFDELSRRLDTLIKQGDALTLSAIAEELGGIRQIGKLLPAIAQFDKARKALQDAQQGAVEGLSGDVAKGLDTVDNRVKRVRESFSQLIRTVFESDAFQNFTKNILKSAENFLKFGNSIVEALEPVLPLLTTIGAFKIGSAIGGFLGGGGVGKVVGGVTGQASAQAGQAAAQASQNAAQATQANTQILNTINTTLTRTSNQLANIFQSLEGNFRTLTTQMSNLIQALAGFRSSAINFAAPITGGRRKSGGGKILGFNRGGMVPGTGNGDTVPAMLEPGEFVIKKSSVNSIGAGQLESMNKYASGGVVNVKNPAKYGALTLERNASPIASKPVVLSGSANLAITNALGGKGIGAEPSVAELANYTSKLTQKQQFEKGIIPNKSSGKINIDPKARSYSPSAQLLKAYKKDNKNKQNQLLTYQMRGPFPVLGLGSRESINQDLQTEFSQAADTAIRAGAQAVFDSSLAESIGVGPFKFTDGQNFQFDDFFVGAKETIEGYLLEAVLGSFADMKVGGGGANFDFPAITADAKQRLANLFDPNDDVSSLVKGDAKRKRSTAVSGDGKLVNKIARDLTAKDFTLTKKASGGSISGEDTVPALLTPGEFVFNKKSASRIGYGNLNRMNKEGVQGFNKGGTVGFKRFAGGGKSTGVGSIGIEKIVAVFDRLAARMDRIDSQLDGSFKSVINTIRKQKSPLDKDLAALRANQQAFTKQYLSSQKELANSLKPGPFDKLKQKINQLGTSIAQGAKARRQSFLASLKAANADEKEAQASNKAAIADNKQAKGLAGANLIGAAFAIQNLTTSYIDADSALGQFTNAAFTAIFALQGFGGLEGIKGTIGTALGGGAAGIGAGAGLIAGGAIAGGLAGSFLGSTATDAIFGKREEIAGVRGKQGESAGDAATRGAVNLGATLGGAGAGAGAAIGTLIAPGIGTAIGAVIGGAGGLITGAIIGAINGPLEQAAFDSAKAVEKSGKELASSLDRVEKDLNSKNLSTLSATLGDVSTNFEGGVKAFQDKFDNGITVAGSLIYGGLAAINPAALAAQLIDAVADTNIFESALEGVDSFLGTSISNESRSLNNTTEAVAALGKLINPEDVKRAKEVNQKALAQLLEGDGIFGAVSGIDFSESFKGELKGLDPFNKALEDAAYNGNELAKSFLETQKNLAKVAVQQEAVNRAAIAQATGKKEDKEVVSFLASAEGASLGELAVSGDTIEFKKALDAATKDLDGPVKQALIQYYYGLRDAEESQAEAARASEETSRLLRDSQVQIEGFITGLNEATNALTFAAQQTETTFANIGNTLDLLTGGGKITALQTADPFEAGAAGQAARQEGIARVGRATGVDVTPIQNFQGAIDELPDIGKRVLQKVKDSGENISPQEVSNLFIEELEKSTGPLGGQLKAAISSGIEGASRQLAGGGEIGADALKKAIEDGKLVEILDKGGEAAQKAITTLVDSLNKLNENIANQAQLEFDQLKKNRDFESSILKKRADLEGKIAAIAGTGAGGGIGAARAQVEAQAVAQAGTADAGALLARRGAAQQALGQFRKAQQEGTTGLSATEQATQLANLTNELDGTTQALKVLSDDTSQLAEIEKEANRLRKQQEDALGGLDKIIAGVAGGDQGAIQATLNQQNALLKVFSGQQLGGGEQLGLLKSLGDADFANLVNFAGEEVGIEGAAGELKKNLTLGLTQSLRNTPLGQALGPTLDLLVKKFSEPEKTIEDLAKEANSIAQRQLAILEQIAGQDAAIAAEQIAIGREAVASNEGVVQREAANVAGRLGGQQQPGTPPATPPAGATGGPTPQLPGAGGPPAGAAGAAAGAAAQQQAGQQVEVGGNRVAFIPEQVGQDVDIGALQSQQQELDTQAAEAEKQARFKEDEKIRRERLKINRQIEAEKKSQEAGGFSEEQRAAGITSSADIRKQGRQQRLKEGGFGGTFLGMLGIGGVGTQSDTVGGTGGVIGAAGSLLAGDTRSLYGTGSFLGADQAVSVNRNTQNSTASADKIKQLEAQRAQLDASREERLATAGTGARAGFDAESVNLGQQITTGQNQNARNAEARQRNQAGAEAAFAENQRRQKEEFKQKQRARVSSARLATGAIDAATLQRAEEARSNISGQTPEGIAIAGGVKSSNVFGSVGADEAKLRSADAIRRGLSADPDSEEFRKARKKQLSLTSGAASVKSQIAGGTAISDIDPKNLTRKGQLELARQQKAAGFQGQQEQKRKAIQANKEALQVQSQFRKGEITQGEAEEKIRGIRKNQFGKDSQQGQAAQPEGAGPTQQIQESIIAGSDQGAQRFAQVFETFAAQLPEQINAVLEPVQLVGTDSIGQALAEQITPVIEQVLGGFFNNNEVPNARTGGGVPT